MFANVKSGGLLKLLNGSSSQTLQKTLYVTGNNAFLLSGPTAARIISTGTIHCDTGITDHRD